MNSETSPYDNIPSFQKASEPFPSQRDEIIKFSTRRIVDKIVITIPVEYITTILQRLRECFIEITVNPKNPHTRRQFSYGPCGIDLILPSGKNTYQRLKIDLYHDPTVEVQNLLINHVFVGLIGALDRRGYPIVMTSQIEFAYDLIPDDFSDLSYLLEVISDGACSHYARGTGSNVYDTTLYLASNGKKRISSKGITVYRYPSNGHPKVAIRVELLANRPYIVKNLPNYAEYRSPIPSDLIDPFDVISYRGFDYEKLLSWWDKNVHRCSLRNCSLSGRIYFTAILNTIERKLAEHHIFDGQSAPLPMIKDAFKRDYAVRNRIDKRIGEFFPISSKDSAIKDDILNGFVRRQYNQDVLRPQGRTAQAIAANTTNANQTEKTVARIIAAIDSLCQEGQQPTQVAVAAVSGVSKGTVRRHWEHPEIKSRIHFARRARFTARTGLILG
jgi:hypothetical protein